MGASQIMKIPGFSCIFCNKTYKHKYDLKVHQQTRCVPAIEAREKPQRRSLGVQTMDLTSTCGVIRYASGAHNTIHPTNQVRYNVQHPALFDRQQPLQNRQFRTCPDRSVAWTNTQRSNCEANSVRTHCSVSNTQQ